MTQANPVYFRVIDLSKVPAPDFVEVLSVEEIFARNIAELRELEPGYVVLESDPAIKVIMTCSYREFLARQAMNDAARQNTITDSTGGNIDVIGAFLNVDRLAGEGDERFRGRVQQGPALLAAAGPRGAYVAHTMGVSTTIIHAGVHVPAPGEVVVTVLGFEDVAEATAEEVAVGKALFGQPAGDRKRILARPSSDLLTAVRARLNTDDIRPLTDVVTVRPPTVLPYEVTARLVIYPGPDGDAVRRAALGSLSAYLTGLRKVAYDATTSGMIAALSVPGVQNVILESPTADVVAGPYDVTICTSVNVVVDRVDV